MKLHRVFAWAGCALALAVVAACNRSPNPASAGRPTVAFISNNPYEFWKIAEKGTEKAAKEFDVNVEFKMPAEGAGAPAQRRFIEDLMTKGVRGIAISPVDAANNVGFLREVSQKVNLVTQDSDVPDKNARKCYIGTDNYKAGRAAGELAKKAAPDGGKVIIYVGQLDVQNAVERRKGVLHALAGKPEAPDEPEPAEPNTMYGKWLVIGTMTDDGKADKCRQNVEDNLTKYLDLKVIVGLWEYNPPAMLRAVKAAKKEGQVAIVGFDENEETLQGIKDGHVIGTIVQNPFEFGYQAVKILAALARDDPNALKRPDIDAEGRIYVPHRVITKENVEAFHEELKRLKGKQD
jgi:ribose transport system substrate-binding protein